MKYRKKPVVIEAFKMTQERMQSNHEWPDWMHQAWNKPIEEEGALYRRSSTGLYSVVTLEGHLDIAVGDFLIQGIKGELYPCKPDIFEATYDEVDPAPARLANQPTGSDSTGEPE